jgi:DNA polymerase bacteriophage-type
VDALRQFMKDADGLDLPDLTKGTVSEVLKQDDLPVLSRRLLNIRAEASSTTPSKYRTMLKSMCADGRIKGMVQFNGAARTGRDAGRIVQLQNLARPAFKNHVLEAFIEAV